VTKFAFSLPVIDARHESRIGHAAALEPVILSGVVEGQAPLVQHFERPLDPHRHAA
jgi:hypothetical protein